jgi:hypothetical protein
VACADVVGAAALVVVVVASLEVVSALAGSVLVSDPQLAKLRPSATAATAMPPALTDILIRSSRFGISP